MTGRKVNPLNLKSPLIISASGLKKRAATKSSAVKTLANPVLAPWAIPVALSM